METERMTDAVEATLTSFSANGKGEIRLGFNVHKDDAEKVEGFVKLVGHDFGLAFSHIDNSVTRAPLNRASESNPNVQHSSVMELADRVIHPNTTAFGDTEPASNRLVQLAGIRPKDREYQMFLYKRYGTAMNVDAAAQKIRDLCDVPSRSQILPGSKAAAIFEELEKNFALWRLAI